MSSDHGFKHNPFSTLRGAVRPAATLPSAPPRPPVSAAAVPLGRVVVRQESHASEGNGLTRVIGAPPEDRVGLGKRCRAALGVEVLIEGRDLLVMTDDIERVAALLRDGGVGEVRLVRREAPPDLSRAGEPGGTRRSQIRRGLRVAIVQKADQETGALTEGVVRDILTSAPEHPRGIKVRLDSGEVGRVRRILSR